MKMNEMELRNIINGEIEKYNDKCNMDIPRVDDLEIKFTRSHKTRAYYRFANKGNDIKPIGFGFSKYLFEEDTDEGIYNTIQHEVSHYIASIKHNTNCGHDWRWEEICKELEMKEISQYKHRTLEEKMKSYRYHIYCECRQEPLAMYYRMDKIKLERFRSGMYSCRHCHNSNLMVIDTKTNTVIAGKDWRVAEEV